MVAATAAGCSSGAMRFTDAVDGITTASTTPQANVGNYGQAPQAYPGPVAQQQPVYNNGGYGSGSVDRSSLPPPSQPSAAQVQPAPVQTASAPVTTHTAPAIRQEQPAHAPSNKPFQAAGEETKRLAEPVKTAATTVASGGYLVQQGDTLSAISRKSGVSVAALQQANGLADGNIRIGQKLTIPGVTSAPAAATAIAAVQQPQPAKVDPVKTASLPAPAAKQATSQAPATYTPPRQAEKTAVLVDDDGAAAPNATGIGKMRWPVKGRVISSFGQGGDGIDISVPKGTSVKAAENGVVIYAGDGLKEFGNTVLVRHENGLVTVYGNASELSVKRGQTVRRGDQIALSGMSGNAKAPKLHFEVRKNSAPVDPSSYLE
ncbi:peptidoglycan DD-metalloendopeptidase family protein [Aquamicrobium segne]|uniref:Peptidoglycan DD-metalloendopeptidase family protein n=1 Tax=Aquamicrobium segne TaxID=469547 RepID=A0ABW0GYJ3_9HYPH